MLLLFDWLSKLDANLKVVMLLLGRGHYSIDVLLAYYVTTRWTNHHH